MKYYCLIHTDNKELALFDDVRQDGNQKITLSCVAVYASKVDAVKMKGLVEKYLKKENILIVKECEVTVAQEKENEKD